MKRIQMLLLGLFLCVLPSVGFAEISLSEAVGADTDLSVELGADMQTDIAYGVAPGPGPGPGPRPSGVSPRPVIRRTAVHPAPGLVVQRTVVRRSVRPVVVVEQPSTVVVADNSVATQVESTPVVQRSGSTFGFGIRGVGYYQGSITLQDGSSVKSRFGGGVGYYFKYRPTRWISAEFTNDFILAQFDDESGSLQQELGGNLGYLRIPFTLGFRIHVFDYGMLDVYGVVAASLALTTIDDGNSGVNREREYYQFGGQFGAGVSITAAIFEFGLDARYFIDQAPDKIGIKGFETSTDRNKPIHGVIFSLNIGLAI